MESVSQYKYPGLTKDEKKKTFHFRITSALPPSLPCLHMLDTIYHGALRITTHFKALTD